MQAPSASDPSFKAFLEKLQEQNNRGFVTQLVQLKAEREIAGEDNDKREEQLNDVISSLKEVRLAVTGNKLDIDLTPLINIGENQTKLLEELIKESSLTRKLTEGSVEYDKEAAQYRNTSGRDIESKVSGKTSKDGGFIDFETARDALSGQGKRAKEANTFDLKPINYTPGKAAAAAVVGKGKKPADEEDDLNQPAFKGFLEEIKSGFKFFMTDGLSEKPGTGIFQTPSKEVESKDKESEVSSPIQENPEADNVASTGEVQADAAKNDLELSKQMLDTTKAQLVELKAIREALAPKTPKDLVEQKGGPTTEKEKESEGGGGGGLLGGLGGMMPGMGGLGKGLMTAGKAVLPYALPAAAMIGTGAAVDYGLGKLGVGKDKEGNDLKIDTKQDDANWAKMSMGQKIQSGVGRGIEKVGSALFLDNMSREAQADRVKNETEYFKDKDFVDSSKEQDEANYKKMSFGKKILSSINRGGEKLSLFDSTKTTAARIRKETEELNKDVPGAATKEALAATLPTVKEKEAAAATPAAVQQQEKVKFRRSKVDQEVIGGTTIAGYESGYKLEGLEDDIKAAEAAWAKFGKAERADDKAGMDAAANEFIQLANKIESPEYKTKMREISAKQNNKKEEKVTGGPGAKDPVAAVTPTTAGNAAVEKKPVNTAAGTIPEEKGILSKAADTAKSIGSSIAGFFGFGDKKKPVDTAAPGKAIAVTPKETVDGKPAAVQPSGGDKFRDALSNAVGSAKQMVSNGEVDPKHLDEAVDQVMANVEGVSPQSANIIEKAVRAELQKSVKNPGERKSGEGAAVTPKETVDGKPAAAAKGATFDSNAASDKEFEAANADQDATEKYASNLDKIAMAEAKKGGRATPDISDRRAAQIIARREAIKTAGPGVTEGTLKGVEVTPGGVLKGGKISNTGKDVAKTSTENADMGREAGKGGSNNTVVSNNVSSNNTTKFVPMKANPRPEYTGSSLDRYTNRITVY